MNKLLLSIGTLVVASVVSFAQTTTFNYTGSMQTYVVPPCVNELAIDMAGAQGGGGTAAAFGGNGGRVQCTIPVTPGQTIYIFVGGQGSEIGGAGYNGGGTGLGGSPGVPGGGGGGATDIRTGGTTLNDRIVVAGGGGGGTDNGGPANGGGGGGLIGGQPTPAANPWACSNLVEPTGGTQSAGGNGGTSVSCAWNGFNGSFGIGGNSYNNYRSAGGGGGWYGGGGGHNGCGGAGGSSYAIPSATSVVHTQGFQPGNGYVSITGYVGPAPAPVAGNDSICSGSSQTYSVPSVAGATSYTWTFPAGTTINAGQGTTTVNVTAGSTSGNISVYATFGACGDGSTNITSLYVAALPVVYGFASDSAICNGDSTTLTGSGASTYTWSGGVTNGVPFAPTASGTYTVVGTDALGCVDSSTVPLIVNSNPTVSLGPDQTICGDTVCLDAGNPGAAYVWSNGDTTQVSCVMSSGIYSVMVNDINGCWGYDTVAVTINNLPTPLFQMPFIFACATDDSIALSATPAGGTFSGPGVTGNMFNPGSAGTGNIILTYTYTDSLGCTGTDTSAIWVDLCLGIADANSPVIQLYPNPNNGVITFTSSADLGETTVLVTDMQGRVVYSSSETNVSGGFAKEIVLDVADGMYLVEINSAVHHEVKQIIIQK